MPRPPLAKSAVPLSPLNGEQVRFWLRILEEHALFIRGGLLGEHDALADKAQGFYQELRALRRRADDLRRPVEVIDQALPVMVNFYQFQRQLLNSMITCQLLSHLYPLQIDHLLRENGYAVRLFEKIQSSQSLLQATKAQENLFWVRIMEDHSQIIGALVDPSERNVVDTARSFTREFDDLYLQGRDFVSFLDRRHQEAPSFLRYLADTRRATMRLRDFTKLAEDLIGECRLIGILPKQLADHLRRETEHYLMILAGLEKNVLSPQCMADPELFPLAAEMNLPPSIMEDLPETDCPPSSCCEEEAERPKWPYQYQTSGKLLLNAEEEEIPREEAVADICLAEPEQEAPNEEKLSGPELLKEMPSKDTAKVKWSQQWPRPLGKKSK